MSNLSTCKKCLEDFPTDDLIWGDKGAGYWICADCYATEQSSPICGDCLYLLNTCNCREK